MSLLSKPKEECLDKRNASVVICSFSDIRHIFKDFHYKKDAMGGGITMCFAMMLNNSLVGGSVIGKPRHEGKYKNCIDIRRMALINKAPYNSETYFLGQIIQWIASNTNYDYILSYSDSTVGHIGTIYKASNFELVGETSPTKFIEWQGKTYHPRSLKIDRPYSYKLRDAIKSGDAIMKTGLTKKIWIFKISKKMKKKKKHISNIRNINQLLLF